MTSERHMANAIRALAMDAVQAANSGHPGMPMGMADVVTTLYMDYLKFDPKSPDWADRDRVILSAGHGSMLAYGALHLAGYECPTMDDIKHFRQLGSPCAGHPEQHRLAGIDATTGPLGQGVAMAVGMAIAERHLNAVFGDTLVDHHCWAIAGDGCLMEGVNHEAVGLAGHLGLGRLIVLWDDNRITIDGCTSLSSSEDIAARYRASDWHVVACDGHDFVDIRRALTEAVADSRPSLVACRTVIGYGAPTKQGSAATHGAPLGKEEVAATRQELGWDADPFEIPQAIIAAWRQFGKRGETLHKAWQIRLLNHENKKKFEYYMRGNFALDVAFNSHLEYLSTAPSALATRKASEQALTALTVDIPTMIGGSADLTGSNNTKTAATKIFRRDDYSGRYLHYGVREFAMAAAMNGIALHGGLIPYSGTFLVFSDYCRAAIRLSALQAQRVIYVMTHDSIGLGEDGPTHQPIEHLQSLRAMPNLLVLRPADAIETAECWAIALEQRSRPSLLALSRQTLPPMRETTDICWSALGGYRLREATKPRRVLIIATGSEVAIACEVARDLEARGYGSDVVSMVCMELFDEQPTEYRADILGEKDSKERRAVLRVSIEAGSRFGWERYVGREGLRFGIDGFGESAPANVLYQHFGLTAEAIVPQIMKQLERAQ